MTAQAIHKQLLISYLAIAKAQLNATNFDSLDINKLQRFTLLISECISPEQLTDPVLARHSIEQLQKHSIEQAVMHTFLLNCYKLSTQCSQHPLERGIIKQKIIGLLPIFEAAFNNGHIDASTYDKNADALWQIAHNSDDIGAIHQALAVEYLRWEEV